MDERHRESFEQVVLPHLDAAYSVARYLVRDDHAAEDVVQEAFLRAIRHFDGYRGENARAWLLTIVRNCCATYIAKARAEQTHAEFDEREHSGTEEDSTPELFLVRSGREDALRRALDALPADAREMVILRDVQDLSYKEIALVAGIPIGTVMSRLARARKRLRDALREELRDAG